MAWPCAWRCSSWSMVAKALMNSPENGRPPAPRSSRARQMIRSRRSFADDNVAISAVDDRLQFRLFARRNLKLVEGLLEVIHERVPFLWRDVEMGMRVAHRASRIFLRASSGPADHLSNEILETRWRNPEVRFVHCGVKGNNRQNTSVFSIVG